VAVQSNTESHFAHRVEKCLCLRCCPKTDNTFASPDGASRTATRKVTVAVPHLNLFAGCDVGMAYCACPFVMREDSGCLARARPSEMQGRPANSLARHLPRLGSLRLAIMAAVVVASLRDGECTVPAAQKQALVDLYVATQGDPDGWKNSAGWSQWSVGGDPCGNGWYGIICSGTNVVYVRRVVERAFLASHAMRPCAVQLAGSVRQPARRHHAVNAKQSDSSDVSKAGIVMVATSRVSFLQTCCAIDRKLTLVGNELSGSIPSTLVNLQHLKRVLCGTVASFWRIS
jgi:hypothetical protein